MRKLSTGADSTLEEYRKLASALWGEGSSQVQFIDDKIKDSPNREREEVIMDERQMLALLASMQEASP